MILSQDQNGTGWTGSEKVTYRSHFKTCLNRSYVAVDQKWSSDLCIEEVHIVGHTHLSVCILWFPWWISQVYSNAMSDVYRCSPGVDGWKNHVGIVGAIVLGRCWTVICFAEMAPTSNLTKIAYCKPKHDNQRIGPPLRSMNVPTHHQLFT